MLRDAIDCALEYMFYVTDCERLITVAMKDNKPSVMLSEAYFIRKGESDKFYYYDLTYSDWIVKSEKARSLGEAFHDTVETNHSEDDRHDQFVGGSIEILKNGNIPKAVKMYNNWAVMSNYEPINVLSINPLVASMGKMMITYEKGKLEEILCLPEH